MIFDARLSPMMVFLSRQRRHGGAEALLWPATRDTARCGQHTAAIYTSRASDIILVSARADSFLAAVCRRGAHDAATRRHATARRGRDASMMTRREARLLTIFASGQAISPAALLAFDTMPPVRRVPIILRCFSSRLRRAGCRPAAAFTFLVTSLRIRRISGAMIFSVDFVLPIATPVSLPPPRRRG